MPEVERKLSAPSPRRGIESDSGARLDLAVGGGLERAGRGFACGRSGKRGPCARRGDDPRRGCADRRDG